MHSQYPRISWKIYIGCHPSFKSHLYMRWLITPCRRASVPVLLDAYYATGPSSTPIHSVEIISQDPWLSITHRNASNTMAPKKQPSEKASRNRRRQDSTDKYSRRLTLPGFKKISRRIPRTSMATLDDMPKSTVLTAPQRLSLGCMRKTHTLVCTGQQRRTLVQGTPSLKNNRSSYFALKIQSITRMRPRYQTS